jgi:hypothetical protein
MDNKENNNNPNLQGLDTKDTDVAIQVQEEDNIIAYILKLLGYAIFCFGFLGGFVAGQESYSSSLNWGSVLLTWAFSLSFGMLFIGFSEVINLLDKIRQNTKRD